MIFKIYFYIFNFFKRFYRYYKVNLSRHGLRIPKLSFIPLEALCFVYGIISCVISIFSMMVLTLLLCTFNPQDILETGLYIDDGIYKDDAYRIYFKFKSLPLVTYFMVLFSYCVCSFFFSAFLCYGINKRRPIYLKAYLWFGLTATTFMCICYLYINDWLSDTPGEIYLIYYTPSLKIAYGIWLLILLVVWLTEQLLQAEQCRRVLPAYREYVKHS